MSLARQAPVTASGALRDAAVAADGPSAPESPSTEDAMPQQFSARGDDGDQHQLLECLRRDFVAHVLSGLHAERDRQCRGCRDCNVAPIERLARRQKKRQQA